MRQMQDDFIPVLSAETELPSFEHDQDFDSELICGPLR